MPDDQKPSFWTSIPGILTGFAALLTAIVGLMLALKPGPTPPGPFVTPKLGETPRVASPSPEISVPPPRMGQLMEGVAYLQADIYSRPTATAAQCSELCRSDPDCKAMTFIKSQQLCWIKNSIPGTASSPDMVSAKKLTRP